jgi:acyl transferase domain-containing protein/acyl carrier protein
MQIYPPPDYPKRSSEAPQKSYLSHLNSFAMQEAEKEKLQQQVRDALIAIKKLKSKLQEEQYKKHEPIAIIGMAMRYPGGVNSAVSYWQLLENGVDAISDIPKDRFDAEALYDPDPDVPGKLTVKQGGFLSNIDQFDGSFFDLSYAEIESMDPQQRLLLEVTHEALENAGIPVQTLVDSNTGVFVGVTNNDYQKRHFRSGDFKLINPYSYTGAAVCSNSGRISYLLGLQGPSIALDTACSSSLVATHLAAQSLRNGECDLAIAGAANVIIDPEFTIYFSTLNALSADSRCKPFANEANGFIRSEGAGVLILKRLSDAQRDGDNILAVVKGSAVNQDGRSNGFTAPNVKAQERLLKAALKDAGLGPEQVDFIEAHGTGTKIGDPIEMEAIAGVFATARSKENPLLVGSVKSNIGHTEGVAGMAGMMKAVLSIRHHMIPKNLHFKTPNELIDWNSLPVKVPVENTAWTAEEKYIGVSGFGVTGTNAHVIIGAAPAAEPKEAVVLRQDVYVLPLSAKTPEALQALAKAYAEFIGSSSDALEDICAMAALKRSSFEVREVFVARDKAALIEQLQDFAEMPVDNQKTFDADDVIKTVFVCPGQGAQWVGMAKGLYASEPVFQASIDASAAAFAKYASWNLIEEINRSADGSRFEEIDVIQPVLVAIEIALGELWKAKGIQPDIVIGHSMGEVAAAYLGEQITLDEAALIICTRSQLMKQTSGQGAMAVTDLTAEEAQQRLVGQEHLLSVAVQNSPNSTVVAGDPAALETLLQQLESEGRFCRKIKVDVASHSPQMEPIMAPLKEALAGLQPQNGSVAFCSTALGEKVSGANLNADYWTKNLRNPVQFGKVVRDILQSDKAIFIELSPHPVLLNAIQENVAASGKTGKGIASLLREKDELLNFHKSVGQYFNSGLPIDWTKIYPQTNRFVSLPNYQWQRERFWFEQEPEIGARPAKSTTKAPEEVIYETVWERTTLQAAASPTSVLIIKDRAGRAEALAKMLASKGVSVSTAGINELPDSTHDVIVYAGAITDDISISPLLDVQKIIAHFNGLKITPRLFLLTQQAQSIQSDDKIVQFTGAMLWGLARTIRNEHPEWSPMSIDIHTSDEIALTADVLSQSGVIREWVYRRGEWFTPQLQLAAKVAPQTVPFNSSITYLITGGTSGLGLVFAEWLASRGVKNLALVSRSGMKVETQPVVARLKVRGVKVEVFQADITSYTGLSKLIMEVETALPPVRGVVHAAGILDDGAFLNLTARQFEKVIAPKLQGAWNLHQYFEKRTLESFVLFSSGASVLGTAAQGNYTAANMALDQLAQMRTARGQAALSINFGNIGEIGLAAADVKRGERLKEQGMGVFTPKDLPRYFDALFDLPGAQYMLMDIDFGKWAQSNSGINNNAFYNKVLPKTSADTSDGPEAVQPDVKQFPNLAAALRHVKGVIKLHVSAVTKVPVAKVKEDATFKSMGIDSLMAVQLKNKFQTDFELTLAVSSIWTYPTVEKYAAFIAEELKLTEQYEGKVAEPIVEDPAINTNLGSAEKSVDEMSLEELMKALEDKSK